MGTFAWLTDTVNYTYIYTIQLEFYVYSGVIGEVLFFFSFHVAIQLLPTTKQAITTSKTSFSPIAMA